MRYAYRQRKRYAKTRLDQRITNALGKCARSPEARTALERLLVQVQARGTLLQQTSGGEVPWLLSDIFLEGIVALASRYEAWVRAPETWWATRSAPLPQFASLAEHLYAMRPVPMFMNSAWLQRRSRSAGTRQQWYIQLGQGRDIHEVDIPIKCTPRMSRFFALAPHHFSPEQALRWAQVRGLGGDKDLAHAVIDTRLGWDLEHVDFWESVIRFLIKYAPLDAQKVASIIAYLQQRKFGVELRRPGRSASVSIRPEEPDLCMKGRKLMPLLRAVRRWKKRSEWVPSPPPAMRWPSAGFAGLEVFETGTGRLPMRMWLVEEILDSTVLRWEGRQMRNCVFSYRYKCLKGCSSIWSLKLLDEMGTHYVLTIEVDIRKRMIIQAKGQRNAKCGSKPRQVMELWARERGLVIAGCL